MLYGIRQDERRTVTAVPTCQHSIRFVVSDDLLCLRIEAKLPTEPVRRVRQMDQSARKMRFLNRGAEAGRVPGSDAVDEVREMVVP